MKLSWWRLKLWLWRSSRPFRRATCRLFGHRLDNFPAVVVPSIGEIIHPICLRCQYVKIEADTPEARARIKKLGIL